MIRISLAMIVWTLCASAAIARIGSADSDCAVASWAETIRAIVLPSWSHVKLEELRRRWPGGLREVGGGSAETWAQLHGKCAVYFVFAPTASQDLRLSRIRLVVIGERNPLVREAELLSQTFGPPLTSEELRRLRTSESVSTGSRTPIDIAKPGLMRVRTVTITRESTPPSATTSRWFLEIIYDQFEDAP